MLADPNCGQTWQEAAPACIETGQPA